MMMMIVMMRNNAPTPPPTAIPIIAPRDIVVSGDVTGLFCVVVRASVDGLSVVCSTSGKMSKEIFRVCNIESNVGFFQVWFAIGSPKSNDYRRLKSNQAP